MTISTADVNKTERIEVLHNTEIITERYLQIFCSATSRWDYFADIKSISIAPLGIESITKAASDAKGRGVKLRFVTEITNDNIIAVDRTDHEYEKSFWNDEFFCDQSR